MKKIIEKITDRQDATGLQSVRYYCTLALLIILTALSIAFCIADYLDDRMSLLPAALGSAFVCIVLSASILRTKKLTSVHSSVLCVFMLVMIAYTIIHTTSESELLWICILPAFAPFILGTLWGTVTDILVLVEILILKFTPLNRLLAEDPAFVVSYRLIIVFIGCILIGLALAGVGELLYSRMKQLLIAEREAAQTDALTGVKNRWWYSKQLESKNEQPEYRRRYAILLIDVDGFKAINDSYGHLFGDEVLIRITDVLKQSTSKGDIICRWGGDEFLCQVRAASEAEACAVAERITEGVRGMNISTPVGDPISIGVSVGVVYIANPGDIFSTELFSIADNALYEAKNCGGTRIKVFSTSTEEA